MVTDTKSAVHPPSLEQVLSLSLVLNHSFEGADALLVIRPLVNIHHMMNEEFSY